MPRLPLATLALPVTGYGLRYEYGMFHQHIENGYQIEDPDHWMRDGHPWEVERPEYTQLVKFGGRTEHFIDQAGRPHTRWVDTEDVYAVPYDVPVSGYDNHILYTNTAHTRDINARLDGKDHSFFGMSLRLRRNARCFMHFKSDPVPQSMTEVRTITFFGNKITSNSINFR